MAQLVIQGGNPLKGVVRLGGAKNSSFKLMIASLLSDQEIRLLNFSRIADVTLVKNIIESLGGKVYSAGERTMFIDSQALSSHIIPESLGIASRASSLFLAPLLARFKKAVVPLPGGDKIGSRPLDRHFEGLEALGAKITVKDGHVFAECQQLTGNTYKFPKNSHTGTETLIMAGALASGETLLENAAEEPEVDDLIQFLNSMGAQIKRMPGRKIAITGVSQLHSTIHKVMPDRNEAVSYAVAAMVTKGDIIIENAREAHLEAFLAKLTQAGGGFEVKDYGIRFFYQQPLKGVDVTTNPHPGFMTDWQPLWAVLATQSVGVSKIIETVFTSRFQFAKYLQLMGSNITFFDPKPKDPQTYYNFNLDDDRPEFDHGMQIQGPTSLKGIDCDINDIRAGATLALAGLAATGTTTLSGLEHIDRGYEDFAGRLLTLGANIKTID